MTTRGAGTISIGNPTLEPFAFEITNAIGRSEASDSITWD